MTSNGDHSEENGESGEKEEDRIGYLEGELAKALSLVESLQKEQAANEPDQSTAGSDAQPVEEKDDSMLTALQENLQLQMSQKAEAENKARLAEQEIAKLKETVGTLQAESSKYAELETKLQAELAAKAEVEHKARQAVEQVAILQAEKDATHSSLEECQQQLDQSVKELSNVEQELITVRNQRDEQHRKEVALTNRLNAAKKKEADKSNLAEDFEEQIKGLERDLDSTRRQLIEMRTAKEKLAKDFEELKKSSHDRVHHAEASLAEERRLNEERKRKMKAFVENKAEELRQAKTDNESLQVELSQTNRSHTDLNNRWTQLHAQYIQSQTRNRELQRDLNRIKKDSETSRKVGDTLEMKLSRSATETEEHKNKRLAAKHELMTVLRTLEEEREVNAKLQDSVKFTFTPKALSQQQLLQETLDDFEAQLQKLAHRLNKALPPSAPHPHQPADESESAASLEDDGKTSRSQADVSRLVSKLERETQAVSQSIMAFSGSVERMHMVLDAGSDRNCYSALSDILMTGGMSSPAAMPSYAESAPLSSSRPMRAVHSQGFGQVHSTAQH